MFLSRDIGFGKIYYSDLLPEVEHFFTTRETNVDENREELCKY